MLCAAVSQDLDAWRLQQDEQAVRFGSVDGPPPVPSVGGYADTPEVTADTASTPSGDFLLALANEQDATEVMDEFLLALTENNGLLAGVDALSVNATNSALRADAPEWTPYINTCPLADVSSCVSVEGRESSVSAHEAVFLRLLLSSGRFGRATDVWRNEVRSRGIDTVEKLQCKGLAVMPQRGNETM